MSYRSRRSSYYGGWAPYVSVAEKRASAEAAVKRAAKKGIIYHPIQLSGRTIATSWWGKSWCDNLERYADFANRLPRGRSYVRNGSVIDLNISSRQVDALVQGSSLYKVKVTFDPMNAGKEKELAKACSKQIQNVEELISGEFPRALQERFLERGSLFPTPKEIHFSCSCPDWASMCKHVAAVMYGIGARLDHEPMKFFELRGIDMQAFVTRAVENKVDDMLKNAKSKKSKRILSDDDIEGLFGIL
ncbi:MAG: hypothetical protein IJ083_09420 [Clostridia bacterium]|nr:hypothetical protein [Clostridia bacterium]